MCAVRPAQRPARRWLVAVLAGAGTFAMLGLATAVVANPVFGRSIAPTPWAMEVLVATSILTGLLTATYVRRDGGGRHPKVERPARARRADRWCAGLRRHRLSGV